MLFNLAKKDALKVYKQQLFEIEKNFDDDFQMVIISYLKPGKKQWCKKSDYLRFVDEIGWPSYYKWNG